MTRNETDNFEAFDLVASALEELELYEASVKAHEAEEQKDSRISASANGEDVDARSGQEALDKARVYLEDAVKEPQETSTEDKETAKEDKKPGGDKEYFKAYYLSAMTDYLSGQAPTAADLFERILNPAQAPETSAHRAAKKAHETADNAFVEEVRYNLGAAQLEARNFSAAIKNFELVINHSEKDSLLQLSARVGMALSLVRDSSLSRAAARKEIDKIAWLLRKDAIFLFRIGWRDGLIIKKRKIDQQTADAFRFVLARARHEVDNKKSQTLAPTG